MSEQITKNQHYVPQFYLKNFSNNDSSVGMYILNREKFVPRASIKENFSEDFLYGEDNVMENNLRKLEGIWSKIISDILSANENAESDTDYIELSYREKSYLLMFIAVSAARTLSKGNAINKQIDGLYKSVLKNEPEFSKHENLIDKINIQYSIPNWIPIEAAKEKFIYFVDLHLAVLNSPKDCGFISSDVPVIKYDQWLYKQGYKYNVGWATKGLQIFLPISRSKCLYLYDSKVYELQGNNAKIEKGMDNKRKIQKIFYVDLKSKEEVEVINSLTIKNADKFLIIHEQKDYESCRALIESEKNGTASKGEEFHNHELPVGEILQFSDPNVKDYLELPFCSIIDSSFEQKTIDLNTINNEKLIRTLPRLIDEGILSHIKI